MYYTHLPERAVLSVSGEEALPFLQGLLTNDVMPLAGGGAVYAMLLSPQGKYQHDCFLHGREGGILLDCEKPRAADLLARFKLYRLRSKVNIAALPETWGVAAAWGGGVCARGFADPRLPELGWRIIGEIEDIVPWCEAQGWQASSPEEYDAMRIGLGVPDGSRDMEIDRAIPLHYGIRELHGIDFSKGCYVGQEVMARTHHRGQIRKFIHTVHAAAALPEAGTPVRLGEMIAGEMRSSAGNTGLAMLQFEAVEKARAGGENLRAGDVVMEVALPPWAVTNRH